MNLNKKIAAFFTASAIALTFTACSKAPSNESAPLPESSKKLADKSMDNAVDKLAEKYENDFTKEIKNGKNLSASKTVVSADWDPDGIISDRLTVGGNSVLSSASLDGMEVSLLAHDITHLPDAEVNRLYHTADCEGKLCADNILLYLKDDSGRKILSTQINGNVPHHCIGEECLFDGSTRIYKTEQDGETYYLLMQYADYDKNGDALITTFYILDMELYEYGSSVIDENGVLCGSLWIVNIADPAEKRIGGWAQGYQASKGFEYKEGTTFYDPEYGYEITFDMKKGKATVIYPD